MQEFSPRIAVYRPGLIDYKEAWDLQSKIHQFLVRRKREPSFRESLPMEERHLHYLILCEHPSVFTLGKSGKESHLLKDADFLASNGIQYYKINRGGDITYHGPGQLVGYPILDLEDFFTDVHRYVRLIEEVIIRVLASHSISSYREKDYTGVWVKDPEPPVKRKICAIGVHLSRWVSMHGFAFNILNDITPFEYIIPCGIEESDRGVAQLSRYVSNVDMKEIENNVIQEFSDLFETRVENIERLPYYLL
jgi:lipoyl(octanoyl) transferase